MCQRKTAILPETVENDRLSEKSTIVCVMSTFSRSALPHHGFTIMNRLSTENLVEPINRDLEFQLQDPFLLYRKGNCEY